MFDLSSLPTHKIEEGVAFDLLHPGTNKPVGVTITLLGADSSEVQELQHKLANKRINDVAKAGGKLKGLVTSEELEAEKVEILVKATKGWDGLTDNGATYPFNPENARRLYTQHKWIREQVEAFISDRSNYLGNSGSDSVPTPAKS
jgi:hypothetical protein